MAIVDLMLTSGTIASMGLLVSLAVILAGYPAPMERPLAGDPGPRQRFDRHIEFRDYLPAELAEILRRLASAAGYGLTADAERYVQRLAVELASNRGADFANARIMRRYLDAARDAHALRLTRSGGRVSNEGRRCCTARTSRPLMC